MAVTAQWCRDSADDCARRAQQSSEPTAKVAYREMVRAWLLLADSAEQLARLRHSSASVDAGATTRSHFGC